jgi:hypothetical protein
MRCSKQLYGRRLLVAGPLATAKTLINATLTGLSAAAIKRRLALNNLCKEAKQALSKGQINLAQAESLTLGRDEAQQGLLERLADYDYSADDIRGHLLVDRPIVALAIFPSEKYTGTITTDLFAAKEESYFDDTEQFFALQKEAVAELYRQHLKTTAWVRITRRIPHRRVAVPQGEKEGEGRRRWPIQPSSLLITVAKLWSPNLRA